MSDAAFHLCVQELEANSWRGIEGILRAAKKAGHLGTSLAKSCLEEYIWRAMEAERCLAPRLLTISYKGKLRFVIMARFHQHTTGPIAQSVPVICAIISLVACTILTDNGTNT